MTKIICISDMHEQHRDLEIPDGDILLVAGDLTYRGSIRVLADFDQWCGELKRLGKVKEVVMIHGNHDLSSDPKKPEFDPNVQGMFTNCHFLEKSSVEVLGLKIWGSAASPFFCNWGHNYHRGDEIQAVWDIMLKSHEEKAIDIILAHGPCYKILDTVEREDWTFDPLVGGKLQKNKEYVGCKNLLKAVKKIKPKLFCAGHIHQSFGQVTKDGIIFVNASSCDEAYKPVNPPIVIEI